MLRLPEDLYEYTNLIYLHAVFLPVYNVTLSTNNTSVFIWWSLKRRLTVKQR